ncbi:MAG: DNA adenine methylase [Candidatus Helarchaeota archaeon]
MKYKKIKNEVKSPLRYPGGKSKAIKYILPLIPSFEEYREPMVGGGSLFIALKQRVNKNIIFKINDLNSDLIYFWRAAKEYNKKLVDKLTSIKQKIQDGRKLIEKYKDFEPLNGLDKAVRFFVLNRITFSGLTDSGGYSQEAFEKRFTESSINRVSLLKPIMKDIIITNKHYEDTVMEEGEKVFIFLDPPYYKATKSKLYGRDGDLHLNFDHERFSSIMKKCPHKWLITYNDSDKIRELFDFANIYEWELQYGMDSFTKNSAKKGKELFIANYKPPNFKVKKLDDFFTFNPKIL